MAGIIDHLNFLVGSSLSQQAASHGNRRVLEEWESYQNSTAEVSPAGLIDVDDQEDSRWASVLNIYDNPSYNLNLNASQESPCVSQLLKKPNSGALLHPIYESLSSGRQDEVVSTELADILGIDDFELIVEILRERESVSRQLEHLLFPKNQANDSRHSSGDLAPEGAKARMEQKFRENAARPLFSGSAAEVPEVLPNVYSSASMSHGNILSQFGQKYLLPIGTERNMHEEYEEVIVPPAKPVPPKISERLVPVDDLSPLAKRCFPGYSSLNRVQSIVYPTAYGTNENLLICAPTGAGKTDVAMLTILRVLDQHRSATDANVTDPSQLAKSIKRDSFKIIYVAPMKALAAEIVRKLGKRLKWLSIQVRELTGDMQMTKAEIAETQIIVTTPEKWDVVTRKPTGEGEIASALKLLIIDEVHLLNEERGAVIEAIVARTLRRVESTQSMIRIVGLSATLPNYVDVADFLSASRYKGLFYFDSSFRPVPLEQHFLGIKGKPGSDQSRKNLDRVTFEKVSELVGQGHQVMVFVHARKETVKSALALKEAATIDGSLDQFSCQDHAQFSFFRRDIGQSKNKEMKLLFDHGFGIHHAGMLRSDRNLMERLFEARAIKVLCCTATLAWGVNLPAHAVVIKGTQVYDSSRGSFVDLSVLDVLQIFGRAGRPGLESSGEGYICTTEDKLTHYLEAVTSQIPIESQFHKGLIDGLNAEIALGTVANVGDAVQWLGYTYLFVRMQKNPFLYGMVRDAILDDPRLVSKRTDLVVAAARKLAEIRMVVFDAPSNSFTITDLGRIAAKYYIRYTTIEIFVKGLRQKMTEADALGLLSQSTEFDQIQVRESEMKELEGLVERIPCDVKGGIENTPGKVNVLLQAYISKELIDDFALVSDTAYVAQNGGRIIRAMLEITMSRKLANVTGVLMGLSKAIENRLWPFDHPLRQFELRSEVLYNLTQWADDWSVAELASQDAAALGKLIHLNEHQGQALLNVAKQFPALQVEYDLRPLGHDVLKIAIRVNRAFTWSTKVHGLTESFWVWVEDDEGTSILQLAHLLFRQNTERLSIDFVISIPDSGPPPSLVIRYVSDRWMGAEDEVWIPLDNLVMPNYETVHTPLLDLPLLNTFTTSNNAAIRSVLERLRVDYFNATQTQMFWSLFKTHCHSLICGPPGSGKSIMSHLLLWTMAVASPQYWAILVAPNKDLAIEAVSELRRLSSGISVNYFTGSDVLDQPKGGRSVRVVQASHLLNALASRNPATPLSGLDMVVCENLELLDSVYELAISSLKCFAQASSTRFIGLSTSLNDPSDVAEWFDVDPLALHSFRPKDRDQSLRFVVQSFTIPHSAALMKAMAKPAHAAISDAGQDASAIVFVPSRGQCRSVALDLLTQRTLQSESDRGYLPDDTDQRYLEDFLVRFRDASVIDFVSKGVGFFHNGLQKADRNLMLELFTYGVVRVLLVPREACWALPTRASVVVVMGTQYLDTSAGDTERQVRDYGLAELTRMQSRAVRQDGEGHFHLFCQAETKDTITRFLNEGLPLESQLLENDDFASWLRQQKSIIGKLDAQQVLDILSFTYLSRRIAANPVYYDCPPPSEGSENEGLSRLADRILERVG